MTKVNSYRSPWANLAAAIIQSGEREHDVVFLEGDWCDTLKLICSMDDELSNRKCGPINIGPTAKLSPGD